jgi:hypothetical protein
MGKLEPPTPAKTLHGAPRHSQKPLEVPDRFPPVPVEELEGLGRERIAVCLPFIRGLPVIASNVTRDRASAGEMAESVWPEFALLIPVREEGGPVFVKKRLDLRVIGELVAGRPSREALRFVRFISAKVKKV